MRLRITKDEIYDSIEDFHRRYLNTFILLQDDIVFKVREATATKVFGIKYNWNKYNPIPKKEEINIKHEDFIVKETIPEPKYYNIVDPETGNLFASYMKRTHKRQFTQGLGARCNYSSSLSAEDFSRCFLGYYCSPHEAIQQALLSGSCAINKNMAIIKNNKNSFNLLFDQNLVGNLNREGIKIQDGLEEVLELINERSL